MQEDGYRIDIVLKSGFSMEIYPIKAYLKGAFESTKVEIPHSLTTNEHYLLHNKLAQDYLNKMDITCHQIGKTFREYNATDNTNLTSIAYLEKIKNAHTDYIVYFDNAYHEVECLRNIIADFNLYNNELIQDISELLDTTRGRWVSYKEGTYQFIELAESILEEIK